ncbi:folate-binding protein YgfZ [Sulfuriferula sp.]|uniref:CAF17-like 4Fe-4S cluster assembly/insertion protein YgfZ n=1 Tax=Sulfuriferula sp. TaxID=2025307 RepID=UPI002730DB39|nr:folate-binding protein [Sulfuriferula sp.]MDP2025480.1 folate-binding protein [Sulfuriferula sp.]
MTQNLIDALHTGTVFADLAPLGLIAFSGEDATTFLQGQLTNDVRKLATGEAQYSGFCSPKGRLLASFLMWNQNGDTYLQLPGDLHEAMQKRLSMFILRSKVKARDARSEMTRIGVAGSHAAALIETTLGSPPDADMRVAHGPAGSVIRLGHQRYQIVTTPELAAPLLETLQRDATPIDYPAWQWLEIQAGIPTILPATQEQFVPQMVNFDLTNSVNFQKGCYTGQEIVARTQYLGKLKRRMYLVHSDSPAAPGDELYSADMEGQASGMIVNAQAAPSGGWDALAVIQISSVAAQPIHLKSLDGAQLRLETLPYALA